MLRYIIREIKEKDKPSSHASGDVGSNSTGERIFSFNEISRMFKPGDGNKWIYCLTNKGASTQIGIH